MSPLAKIPYDETTADFPFSRDVQRQFRMQFSSHLSHDIKADRLNAGTAALVDTERSKVVADAARSFLRLIQASPGHI